MDVSPLRPSLLTKNIALMCHVCCLYVKKSAVICAQCSLIAHVRCTSSAPPACGLRTQVLLYAQHAEQATLASPCYDTFAGIFGDHEFPVTLPEVSYTPSSPNDDSLSTQSPPHADHHKHSYPPPTTFKLPQHLQSHWTHEPSSTTTPTAPELEPSLRRTSLHHERSPDRPTSFTSEARFGSTRNMGADAQSINSSSAGRYRPKESSTGGQSSSARCTRSDFPSTESDIHKASSTKTQPQAMMSHIGEAKHEDTLTTSLSDKAPHRRSSAHPMEDPSCYVSHATRDMQQAKLNHANRPCNPDGQDMLRKGSASKQKRAKEVRDGPSFFGEHGSQGEATKVVN